MSHEKFQNKKNIVENALNEALDIESINYNLQNKDFHHETNIRLNNELNKLNKLNNPISKIIDEDAKSISNISKKNIQSKFSQDYVDGGNKILN